MNEFTIDGIVLRYRIIGKGSHVLMIHGLGSDMRAWEFQEKPLSKHFKLILVDQRGHGRSTGPGMNMIPAETFANDMNAFLDHLGLEKVHVLGESMGGIIAQQFALDYPHKVSKLVLMDTGFKVTEETVDEVYGWREAQVEGGDVAYFWASTRSCFPSDFIESNKELFDYLLNRENLVNEEGILAAGLGLVSFNAEDKLHQLSMPTLLVHGDQDKIFNVGLAKKAVSLIPHSRLVVYPGCGHVPRIQMKDELNALLIDFLSN
ncbi:MAG: alpha/beta fold hydrolase [Candidatus Thorarchaeota archaeon]